MCKLICVDFQKVRFRECPGCGFVLSQKALESVQRNFSCPRCGSSMVSEFEPRVIGKREGKKIK